MPDKIVNHFVLADGSTAKYDAGSLINLDDTVSLAGYAPDAKAVGDRLSATEETANHADELATTLNEGGLELKDGVIAVNVEDWLNAHPEATTTVQDGAITEPKINSTFLPKLQNAYVTPEMFGAKGDGTTDDTTALQAAINSALTTNKGKAVLLTKQYRVTNTLNISANNLHIRGSGQDCVILKDFSGDLFATTTTRVFYLWFEGFAVDGKYTTGSVIKSSEDYRMSSLLIKNVCIYHAEKALDLVSTYCSNIEDCVIVNNTTAIELTKANAVNISGCNITENTNGLIINSGTVISVIGNTFQTMAVPFKVLSIEDLTIVSNYFEYCDAENTNILDIDGTNSHNVHSVTIIGNRFVPNDITYVSTITPVSLKWVLYGLYACNKVSDRYTRDLYLDSKTQYVQYDKPISPKYINESNYCRGFIVPYIEGSTSNPANARGTMAWDRYRYKPIWWDGSKWVYADGTERT